MTEPYKFMSRQQNYTTSSQKRTKKIFISDKQKRLMMLLYELLKDFNTQDIANLRNTSRNLLRYYAEKEV